MSKRIIILLALILALTGAVLAQTEEEELECPSFETSPADVRIGYYMGEGAAFMAAGQYASAIDSYSCIIQQIDANYIGAWLNRAVAHTMRRSFDLAIEDYTAALDIDDAYVPAYNNRGIVHAARLEYDEALADFDAVLDLAPDSVLGFTNRGVILAAQGDLDAAAADFEQAIQLADLGGILDLLKREDDPETEVDESDVTIPDYDATLAQAYALLGMVKAQAALESYQDYLLLRGNQRDFRIESAAGALESRFNFELRFDDSTWLLTAEFSEG